ncbi:RDD family protein [Sphingobacterium tabacisoli]|uniref:RDD family protein n=1 Tax=Sphingobacterium tabacisoli TaxID=2044855 RepID=A0ABW5L355_9SPHI|nr:RDD family protein [Sphingobacterium tabacisoli]
MFVIFGTKTVGKTVKTGSFYCPQCDCDRPYQLQNRRRYFSLFFIPVLPLEKQPDTLSCNFCKSAYVPRSILSPSEYVPTSLNGDLEQQQLASFGKRIGSYFIDLIFLVLLNFPLAILAGKMSTYLPSNYILVFTPVWMLYFFLMEWLLKGTLGKKIVGIKIISDTKNKSVSVFQYFIRSLIKMVPVINIVLFFNDKRKGCHDFAAQTIVVES